MKKLLIGIIHHSSFMAESAVDSLINQLPKESLICVLNNPEDSSYVKKLETKYSSTNVSFLYQDSPKGFAENMNHIFEKFGSHFDYFMPFNDDAIASNNLVNSLFETLTREDVDVACPKILNVDGSIQPVYGPIPNVFTHISRHLNIKILLRIKLISDFLKIISSAIGMKSISQYIRASDEAPNSAFVERLSGACFMIKTSVFRECKGFDDKNFFMYSDDSDLSIRLNKMGRKIYLNDNAYIIHELSASMNTKAYIEKEKSTLRFLKKHGSSLMSLSLFRLVVVFRFIIKTTGIIFKLHRLKPVEIISELRRNYEIIKIMISPIKLKD